MPEELGGAGTRGLLELCIVPEQMGRIPLPGPFFSSAVAATLAARALGATELLGDLAVRHAARHGRARANRVTASRSARCGHGRGARGRAGW